MLFMRFAYVVQPRNWLLFACHFSNECVQVANLTRWANWRYFGPGANQPPQAEQPPQQQATKAD